MKITWSSFSRRKSSSPWKISVQMSQVTGLLAATSVLTMAVMLGNTSLQQGPGEEVVEAVVWLAERQSSEERRRRRESQDNMIVAGLDTVIQ